MRRDARIEAAIRILLQRDTTVRELAAESGVSPSRFSRLFVLGMGTPPGTLLRVVKMYRSERTLAEEILCKSGSQCRTFPRAGESPEFGPGQEKRPLGYYLITALGTPSERPPLDR